MKITQPRLANTLHENTDIQTALEKNDEDLTEYSFKSLCFYQLQLWNVQHTEIPIQRCSFQKLRPLECRPYRLRLSPG